MLAVHISNSAITLSLSHYLISFFSGLNVSLCVYHHGFPSIAYVSFLSLFQFFFSFFIFFFSVYISFQGRLGVPRPWLLLSSSIYASTYCISLISSHLISFLYLLFLL
ncbi:hypothetical protein CPB84DRAFT_1776377 [Gymnopilus junonius]|uniref:Uncharacterized protein n=1 Tax=Gymnopilus junonius TaxID=109634 RepID=A0A9P5NPV4_GYMJU|nr:hypothetical protein CPB84DRAFT_1776377 [Gymnopilus junonius]